MRPALWGTALSAAVLTVLAVAAAPSRAAAGTFCDASAYALSLRSLTGPKGSAADLAIRVTTASADCEVPQTLDDVKATIGTRTVERQQVAAPNGAATVRLGRVKRLQRVGATIQFGGRVTLQGQARTLFKPDLVVKSVRVPRSSLSGRAFNAVVTLTQPTRDVAVTATVTVSAVGTVVGAATAKVAPRGRRAVVRAPSRSRPPAAPGSTSPRRPTSRRRPPATTSAAPPST